MVEGQVLRANCNKMTDHEQMVDAERQCVPCKLCGGKAIITDAGTGAGYYIRCDNHRSFKSYTGCMISERRVSGWAYNVMEWWNRLHSTPTLTYPDEAQTNPQALVEALCEALEPFAEVAAWAERNGHDLAADFDMLLRGPSNAIAGHLHAQAAHFTHARQALSLARKQIAEKS